MPNLGLDVGTGYCKAYCATGRVLFPDIVLMREQNIWNRLKRKPMILIGENAEASMLGRGRLIRPVAEGRIINDEAYSLVVQEALERLRLKPSDTKAIAGTTSRISESELSKLESLLHNTVGLSEVQIYPSTLGTLISMELASGVIVDIGEGSTNFLAVEDKEIIDFATSIIGVDTVLEGVRAKLSYEIEADILAEEIRLLATSVHDKLKKYTAKGIHELTAETVQEMINNEASYFSEEISDIIRTFLRKASTPMLENIIITGGGTYFFEAPLSSLLSDLSFKKPSDPSFANAEGLYKIAEAIFEEPPSSPIEQENETSPENISDISVESNNIPDKITITPSNETIFVS